MSHQNPFAAFGAPRTPFRTDSIYLKVKSRHEKCEFWVNFLLASILVEKFDAHSPEPFNWVFLGISTFEHQTFVLRCHFPPHISSKILDFGFGKQQKSPPKPVWLSVGVVSL
jgi:hypothetical protein